MKVQYNDKTKELILTVPIEEEGHISKTEKTRQFAYGSATCLLPWTGKLGKIRLSAYEDLQNNAGTIEMV